MRTPPAGAAITAVRICRHFASSCVARTKNPAEAGFLRWLHLGGWSDRSAGL